MDLVIGLGELGRPLLGFLRLHIDARGRDIDGDVPGESIRALHICYPFSDQFVAITEDYIIEYEPEICIIHSTIAPGTTEVILNDCYMAYSPVRGRHGEMHRDLMRYDKYVAGIDAEALAHAVAHLHQAGFNVATMSSCRALELAKLVETSYSGLLISWAQELDRFCGKLSVSRKEIIEFTSEIEYLPDHAFFPGYIDGHCIIPNTHLLDAIRESPMIAALRESNDLRLIELNGAHEGRYTPERIR